MASAPASNDSLSVPTEGEKAGHSMLRAFRHRNYKLYFAGQLVSLVGTFLTQYATIWFVYRLTHSLALLGIVGFLGQLPLFVISPFAGVYADRVNRRKFIIFTQSLSMLQSLGLAAVAFWWSDNAPLATHMLIGLAIIQGTINAFDLPARQAFLVEIVTDRADLPNAIALNSTMVHGARVIGPAAAGLVIQACGESLCFFIDAVSYIAVIAALIAMVVIAVPPRKTASVKAELLEGLHYVWHFTPVRTLLLFMAVLSLTALPASTLLMPVFGDYFGGHANHGPVTYGALGSFGSWCADWRVLPCGPKIGPGPRTADCHRGICIWDCHHRVFTFPTTMAFTSHNALCGLGNHYQFCVFQHDHSNAGGG